MNDATQSKTRHEKVESSMQTARSFLLSEINSLEERILKIQTSSLKSPEEAREYESVLEELNRNRYTAEMLDMLIKYY